MSAPATDDANATAAALLARAAQDLADAQAAAQQQNGGIRNGILPGGGH